jgi:hypothetical protein
MPAAAAVATVSSARSSSRLSSVERRMQPSPTRKVPGPGHPDVVRSPSIASSCRAQASRVVGRRPSRSSPRAPYFFASRRVSPNAEPA